MIFSILLQILPLRCLDPKTWKLSVLILSVWKLSVWKLSVWNSVLVNLGMSIGQSLCPTRVLNSGHDAQILIFSQKKIPIKKKKKNFINLFYHL